MATLTKFLGWCTVINIAFLMFSSIMIALFKEPVTKLHSKWFGLEASKLPKLYFQYLGNYKIAMIIFSLVPYLVLRLFM